MPDEKIINGTYKIIEQIGHGSGGIVYKAYHERLNKYVVLKQLRTSVNFLTNSRNEADLLKNIHHPYLPQVYDFVEDGENVYTVIDYIDGKNLSEYQNNKPLSFKEAKKFSEQLCEAVVYLHNSNPKIIHSDIKPANVMIKPDGNICLIDFNISLSTDTTADARGGTKGYASPEQMVHITESGYSASISAGRSFSRSRRFSGVVSEKSDIYSVGAVMYYMLTGCRPDEDYNNITSISEFVPKPNEELSAVAEKAMSLNPNDRYDSAKAMLEAINGTAEKKRKRNKSAVITAIVTVICLAGAAGAGLFIKNNIEAEHKDKVEKYSSLIEKSEKYTKSKDFAEAYKCIDEAIEIFDELPDAYYRMIAVKFEERDYSACISYFGSHSEILFSDDFKYKADLYYIIGRCFMDGETSENYNQDAVSYFENSIKNGNRNSECYSDCAIAYARAGEIDRAEKLLEDSASDVVFEDSHLMLTKGEISKIKGDCSEAVDYLKKCIEKADRTDDDAYYRIYRAANDIIEICSEDDEVYETEKSLLSEIISDKNISPDYRASTYRFAADMFYNKSNFTAAETYYRKAIENDNRSIDTYKGLSEILLYNKNYDECLGLLEKMDELFSDAENYYYIPMRKAYIYYDMAVSDKSLIDKAEEYYHAAEPLYEKYKSLTGKADNNMKHLSEVFE